MKIQNQIFIALVTLFLISSCCTTYTGYGRYIIQPDCEKIIIDGQEFKLTKDASNEYSIGGHTITRGIYRKTRTWLYIHNISEDEKVDVTFEEGSKDIYPLYTGSFGSIFDTYSKPYNVKGAFAAQFNNNFWLVGNRYTPNGLLVDVVKYIETIDGNSQRWELIDSDILISSSGTQTIINSIVSKVKIDNYNYSSKTCKIEFEIL